MGHHVSTFGTLPLSYECLMSLKNTEWKILFFCADKMI